MRVPYPGKIRCGNARQASRLPYGECPFIQDVDNLGGQYGAQLIRIGIRVAQITKNVAAAADKFKSSLLMATSPQRREERFLLN